MSRNSERMILLKTKSFGGALIQIERVSEILKRENKGKLAYLVVTGGSSDWVEPTKAAVHEIVRQMRPSQLPELDALDEKLRLLQVERRALLESLFDEASPLDIKLP